jgi:hypothetical protein
LWPLLAATNNALVPSYAAAMERAGADAQVPGTAWMLLLPAYTFEPEALTTARLRVRVPYNAPVVYDRLLAEAEAAGLLAADAEGGYRLSERGRAALRAILDAGYQAMAGVSVLPAETLERLAALLRRLVGAALAAPEPPGKWSLRLSRRTDPGAEAAVVARIDQYLTDLGAYRDDAHLSAWQPLGVSPEAWESLTLLWRGEAATLDELHAKLARRRRSREEYAAALAELQARGLAVEEGGRFAPSAQGRDLREEAERLTDRYFYGPFAVLSEAEQLELRELLERLSAALRQAVS